MPNTVTIRLKPEDMTAVAEPRPQTTYLRMSTSILIAAAAGAATGGAVTSLLDSVVDTNWSEIWLLGAIIGAILGAWAWARWIETAVPKVPLPDGAMSFTVDEAGVKLVHADVSSQHSWRAISGVRTQPAHLIITTAWAGHFVLPARDFASLADFHTFTAETLRLFNANRGASHVET